MTKVFVAMSMSLDGVIGGSDAETDRVLHEWFFAPSERDTEIIDELRETIGAVVMGRRTYDEGDRNDGFVDNPYPVDHFVLSHDVPETMAKGGTSFTFVSDGIESALTQATDAAGDDDVCVMGGADTVRQFLRTGLIDEKLRPHGLQSTQFSVLAVLAVKGPTQLGELADILGLERTSLTRSANRLEDEGWVTDAESEDARVRRLKLTSTGREKVESAYPAWKEVQDEVDEQMEQLAAE